MQLIIPVTLAIIVLIIYPEHAHRGNDRHRAPGRAAVARRCLLAAVLARLQHECRGVGGGHRLAGLSAETGVVMLLYLDVACDEARRAGRLQNAEDLMAAVAGGAARRVRPVLMLSASTVVGLLPIMWSQGTGADVMKRIAAPMVGGLITVVGVVSWCSRRSTTSGGREVFRRPPPIPTQRESAMQRSI